MNQIEQMAKDLKDQKHLNIENEEQIQMLNKRVGTLEGGSAGVLGLLERVDDVSFFFESIISLIL